MSPEKSPETLPAITDSHVQVAEYAWLTQDRFIERAKISLNDHAAFRGDILVVLRALASGSVVPVPREEYERLTRISEAAKALVDATGHVREGGNGAVIRVIAIDGRDALDRFGNLCDVLAAHTQ